MTEPDPIVFVIDDDDSVRKSLSRVLRSAGYRTETFASARDFLQHGPSREPGCLVLDLQLPDMDGLELQQVLAQAAQSYV